MIQRSSLQEVLGASRSSSDWSGVLKLALGLTAAVGGYFVWRQFVVVGSTARGVFGGSK
jgi:hypothetical protein